MSSDLIYQTCFIENKYQKLYFKIIGNRLQSPLSDTVYTESHHILPRCMSGQNHKQNLVCVSAREHFILHWLLTKMTDGRSRYKMLEAFQIFQNNKSRGLRMTSRAIASMRQANAFAASARNIGNTHWKLRRSDSPETLHKQKEHSSKCRWINDGALEKFEIDHVEFVQSGNWKYGRIKQTKPRKACPPIQAETRKRIGIASKNALTGKKKSEQHIRAISISMKEQNKIQCEHCNGVYSERNYKASHGEHCKFNPVRSQKSLRQEETARANQKAQQENACEKECPHCGFKSKQHSNLKRWHFDNCRYK